MTERGYIPENQQVQTQPEPEQRRPRERTSTGLKRVKQIGPLMAVMLAANLGLVGAAKAPDSHEPEVQHQALGSDIMSGIGSFTNPGTPPTPDGWTIAQPPTDIAPIYENTVAVSDWAVAVQTDGTLPCQSNGWITIGEFAVNPNNTYNLDFEAAYLTSESPHGIDPKVTLSWKDSQDNPLSNPTDNPVFTGVSHADSWGIYSKTYGPGQITIPQRATKVTVEIQGNQTDPSCSGKLYYDNLDLKLTTIAPTPTPPASVGGIAEIPNLPPASMTEHTQDEKIQTAAKVVGVAGSVFAAAGVIELERRRRNKKQHD